MMWWQLNPSDLYYCHKTVCRHCGNLVSAGQGMKEQCCSFFLSVSWPGAGDWKILAICIFKTCYNLAVASLPRLPFIVVLAMLNYNLGEILSYFLQNWGWGIQDQIFSSLSRPLVEMQIQSIRWAKQERKSEGLKYMWELMEELKEWDFQLVYILRHLRLKLCSCFISSSPGVALASS